VEFLIYEYFYALPDDHAGKRNILYIEVEFNSEAQSRLLRRKTLRGRKFLLMNTFMHSQLIMREK
jgi:hypothetical protein